MARGLAISPQKLNDFAKVVRGLHVEDALIQVRGDVGVGVVGSQSKDHQPIRLALLVMLHRILGAMRHLCAPPRPRPRGAHARGPPPSLRPSNTHTHSFSFANTHISHATLQCAVSPKKAAKLVQKALQSARANAINNHGLEPERLRVGETAQGGAPACLHLLSSLPF